MIEEKNESGQTRSRAWVLTVPAEGEHGQSREQLEAALSSYDSYIGQLEKGESGYLHWHVLLVHKHAIRFDTLKKVVPKGHWEPKWGTMQQALAYVTKKQTRVPGEKPLAKGEIKTSEQGKRSDLEELREVILLGSMSLDELIINHPLAASYTRMCQALIRARDAKKWKNELRIRLKVTVIFGETGTGKTRTLYQHHQFKDVCRVTHYGSGKFDHYSGHSVLAMDEFAGQIPIQELLTLCDIYPLELPARYEDKIAAYQHVYIISNTPPWDWYECSTSLKKALSRRFTDVIRLDEEGKPLHIELNEVKERMIASKQT